MSEQAKQSIFTRYQIFIIAVLAFIQFTVILDFIIVAPLGALLMSTFSITPGEFGSIVSAYAFSAGLSGFLAAGFADRYDRKKFLLFFYAGFIIGTFLCGIADSFAFLLGARIITGIFGGVIASVSLAIVADLFPLNIRSRVMGFVQMSFAVAQVAGIPLGIYLANNFGWHAPFMLIVAIGIPAGIAMMKLVRPINEHLAAAGTERPNAFRHLATTISAPQYTSSFITTAMLTLGGFLMMPFSSAFLVYNVGITQEELPLVFIFTGLSTIIVLPIVGRISDSIGKLRVFTAGTLLASVMIIIYTHLGITPLWEVIVLNVILFAGMMSRMIPATTLMTGIPDLTDRGAFMSISSSLQQVSGGVGSVIAGMIIIRTESGALQMYDVLGYATVALMLGGAVMMRIVNRQVEAKGAATAVTISGEVHH
ncbi:MAG: MFS transporter [Bacteroidetes bacterium]|nr:MFS transporter [Bacteroidota bacterium]